MRRLPFRTLAVIGLIAFSLALYREWVDRNKPPLFLPLGFSEQALSVVTLEEESQNPLNWRDPIAPKVLDASDFDAMSSSINVEIMRVDVLVAGATLGGTAAALAAAEDGLSVALVTAKDWRMELLAEAGEFSAERALSDSYGSALERELRQKLRISLASAGGSETNGLPSDAAAHLESRLSKATNVRILSPYDVIAFGRGDDGRITRALLQSPDGSTSITTSFNFVIDGTNDGSILARAGVASRSSWTETDAENEPETPSVTALKALAEGYSMSGRTLPGIGKRVEGAKMYVGVRDRGYNGWFVSPMQTDPCWRVHNETRAFLQSSQVLRANATNCSATMLFEADYQDSVELFWINHGNDSVHATVRFGSGNVVRVYKQFDPSATFASLGVFPAGPSSPLSIEISSVLPVDKLEGLIVRKVNAGGRAVSFDARGGEETSFETGGWNSTFHDIYFSTDAGGSIEGILVDDLTATAGSAGSQTYVLHAVPLKPGMHTLKMPEGVSTAKVMVIPTSPARESIPLSAPLSNPARIGYTSWEFAAPRDGRVIFAAPAGACNGQCYAYVTEKGSGENEAEAFLTDGTELVGASYPMFTLDVKKGTAYVISVDRGYNPTNEPTVSFVDSGADIYASGGGKLRVAPLRPGDLYDIWLRTRWPSETNVSIPSGDRGLDADSSWQYVSTEILDPSGVTLDAAGFAELLATPNVFMDAYRIPLSPVAPSVIEGIPHGSYDVTSFGIDDPERVRITDPEDGRVSIVEFDGDNGVYVATSGFVHGKGPFVVSLTNEWPQTMVMYERLKDEETAKTSFGSGALLLVLDEKAMGIAHPNAYADRASKSAGAFLFMPKADGVGPVTIGTMGTPEEIGRIQRFANDAYLLLRLGRTNLTKPLANCSMEDDPTCDPRRYIRDPHVFGTTDAMSPMPLYPEGRRLDGRETLTYAKAHAVIRPCMHCELECVDGTIDALRCVRKDSSAWNESGIVSFPGVQTPPALSSPLESYLKTLPALFKSMRRDGLIGAAPTYFEEPAPARDITLTLGMIVAAGEPNVLAANTTVSATHGASTGLRSPTAEMLIGSAAGHAVGFAMMSEKSPLPLIADSPDALKRLQKHLIDKGVNVMPTGNADDDPLLMKAIQRRVLEGRAWLEPAWTEGRLTYALRLPDGEDTKTLQRQVFGEIPMETMKDILRWLEGSDTPPSDAALLKLGIANGMVNDKMLVLTAEEIMAQSLNEDLLLKAEYVIRTR